MGFNSGFKGLKPFSKPMESVSCGWKRKLQFYVININIENYNFM
jgi:hypothetical protein